MDFRSIKHFALFGLKLCSFVFKQYQWINFRSTTTYEEGTMITDLNVYA